MNAGVMGVVAFAAVAAATGYGVTSASPQETGAVPYKDDLSPLSCPEYLGDEVASFEGSGDRLGPGFEVEPRWGYEYDSWGYGALRMTVVDERGKASYGEEDAPPSPVGSTGGGEYDAGGTYRLEVDADDEANYEVLVCDEVTQGDTGSAVASASPTEVERIHPASSKARRAASGVGPAYFLPFIHLTSK